MERVLKRGASAAITLAMAIAAMRFAAPFAQPNTGAPPGPKPASKSQPIVELSRSLSNIGGCSAYGPEVSAKPGIPYDENAGAATKKINGFFAFDKPEKAESIPAKLPADTRYAIAITPDPVHTHLSLMFDRQIALVQQAAEDDGYVYNSSWFPWRNEPSKTLEHLADRQYDADLSDSREACPGVILFRKDPVGLIETPGSPAGQVYSHALVIFVVGEQPTGGINEDQWSNSLALLSRYAQGPSPGASVADRTLRVLGPTFTGSLTSLERLLAKSYSPRPAQPGSIAALFPNARVLSGSVTGCSVIQWFEHRLQEIPEFRGRIQFGTFQENDTLHIFRFLEYLKSQGTEPSDSAILSEDETAYAGTITRPGGALAPPDSCEFPYAEENRPVHMVYPRDISALRDEYQKQSVFATSEDTKRSARAILKDEIEEKGDDRVTDTVPTYSKNLSALDQEAYLFGVVSFLRTHHTRYLLLRSTNPLDFLFLTRFFHREYPEARIVIVGSDMLLRREIDTTEFRGVLALSSYPLIPRGQHWSRITEDDWEIQPHNHLIFGGHLMEGMYIAARYVLEDLPVNQPIQESNAVVTDSSCSRSLEQAFVPPLHLQRSFAAPDYADPFWFHAAGEAALSTHPPTWLAVIGRDGFWPLAVIRDDQDHRDPELRKLHLEVPLNAPEPNLIPPSSLPRSTMVELDGKFVGNQSKDDQHYQLKLNFNDPRRYDKTTAFDGLQLNYPIAWTMCLLISLFLAGYQLIGVFHGSSKPYRIFSIFRRTEEPNYDLLWGVLSSQDVLLATSCALALLPLIEVLGFGSLSLVADTLGGEKWQLLSRIGFLVAVVVMTIALYWKYKKPNSLLNCKVERSVWLLFDLFVALELFVYNFAFGHEMNEANRIPLVYRMAHLTCGVSPLIPILLLTLGFYLWNWQAVAGNLMLAAGSPELPRRGNGNGARETNEELEGTENRISEGVAEKILKVAKPLTFPWRIAAIPIFLLFSAMLCFRGNQSHWNQWNFPLLSLEGNSFNLVSNALLLLGFLLTAGEALRLYFTWVSLQRLLQALSRLRLRRTLAQLRPIDSHSLWSVSGNVPRIQYQLFDRQLGAAKRTELLTEEFYGHRIQPFHMPFLRRAIEYGDSFKQTVESRVEVGILWDRPILPLPASPAVAAPIRPFICAAVAEIINVILLPEWKTETNSLNMESGEEGSEELKTGACKLPLSEKPHIQAAEEFVSFHYIAFIQNIVARLRTMTFSMVLLFVSVCFSISFYPFVPRTEISIWMILNLALVGLAVAYVYADMERDEIMSYIANTKPGRLGTEFWMKLFAFLIGPVIGILTTQFPAIADSALGWLQPGLDAMK